MNKSLILCFGALLLVSCGQEYVDVEPATQEVINLNEAREDLLEEVEALEEDLKDLKELTPEDNLVILDGEPVVIEATY